MTQAGRFKRCLQYSTDAAGFGGVREARSVSVIRKGGGRKTLYLYLPIISYDSCHFLFLYPCMRLLFKQVWLLIFFRGCAYESASGLWFTLCWMWVVLSIHSLYFPLLSCSSCPLHKRILYAACACSLFRHRWASDPRMLKTQAGDSSQSPEPTRTSLPLPTSKHSQICLQTILVRR